MPRLRFSLSDYVFSPLIWTKKDFIVPKLFQYGNEEGWCAGTSGTVVMMMVVVFIACLWTDTHTHMVIILTFILLISSLLSLVCSAFKMQLHTIRANLNHSNLLKMDSYHFLRMSSSSRLSQSPVHNSNVFISLRCFPNTFHSRQRTCRVIWLSLKGTKKLNHNRNRSSPKLFTRMMIIIIQPKFKLYIAQLIHYEWTVFFFFFFFLLNSNTRLIWCLTKHFFPNHSLPPPSQLLIANVMKGKKVYVKKQCG